MQLLHEKLVNEVHTKTLSSTFFYNIQNNKVYINDKVKKEGVILKKKRTLKGVLMLKDVIKSARLECGYTQEEIAKLVKVAKQTYLKWENGDTEPKATQIKLLAEHLKITPNEICSGARNKKIDLEEFIIRLAMSQISNEILTMYTWKMVPDHEQFFKAMRNLSKEEYFDAVGEVASIEQNFR
ncbi:helix-turn-helix transcriptional regulator [Vibrio fluvialis]|uniref:helix-turn-helix transcriptional regulator n=1 Tax=Vibrio fluvialis TaxID=676 RepID=UPI00301CA519